MPLVVAYEEARSNLLKRTNQAQTGAKIGFLNFPDDPEMPHATLNEHAPGPYIDQVHFHNVDQFHLLIDGKFRMGRHELEKYAVHFSRAYTPYGPLVSDTGFTFLVLRAHRDMGPQHLSKALDRLKRVPDRKPWQTRCCVEFPGTTSDRLCSLRALPGMNDDAGLGAYALTMQANAQASAPDPACGDGQYLIVLNGSFWHENREYKALSLVFVRPEEGPYRLHAGADGLEAIILNFPQLKRRDTEARASAIAGGGKKWQCALCAFAYDEALGMPDEGIAAGTRWEDVPETWNCPDCSAGKGDFQMVEVRNS
jgi:rubredoxin